LGKGCVGCDVSHLVVLPDLGLVASNLDFRVGPAVLD
jgi:hypothetical protein